MYKTYKEIYERYLLESKKIAKGVVLKTDSHNESGIYDVAIPIVPEIENCYCIEYDEIVLNKAKTNYPLANIIKGDIRDIPFKDKFFDTIIDLSTIDHIHPDDVYKVLAEYQRVCKGEILMVAWTGNNVLEDKPRASTEQYYFCREWFEKQLNKYFEITYKEDLFEANGNVLVFYLLK